MLASKATSAQQLVKLLCRNAHLKNFDQALSLNTPFIISTPWPHRLLFAEQLSGHRLPNKLHIAYP